jgi:integrase
MDRTPTGQLYVNRGKRKTVTSYGVRFRYAGKRRYVTLQNVETEAQAKTALAQLMADVQRGLWVPPEERVPEEAPREIPTFHAFASSWFSDQCLLGGREGKGLSSKGRADLEWRFQHLLPFFQNHRLDQITVEQVDRYRRAKVREGRLSPGSINKMLELLAAVLEVGVEYGHLERNPARGRNRRLKAPRPSRTYLDRAAHIAALIDAASELDQEASRRTTPWRRALIATLVFAGLRIGEALELRWRDLDLATGAIRVRGTKTDAADRTVDVLPVLRDELLAYAVTRPDRRPNAFVFSTSRSGGRYGGGEKHSPSNIRNRVLRPAVERANTALRKRGEQEMPSDLTPHSLRRTFASLLVALGRDPAYFMAQMGHTTANLTLSVYAKAMASQQGEREHLRALVEGRDAALEFAVPSATGPQVLPVDVRSHEPPAGQRDPKPHDLEH